METDTRPPLKITEPVRSGMPVVKLETLSEPELRGVVNTVGPEPCRMHKRCPGRRVSIFWNGQTGPCGVTCTARTIVKDGTLTIPLEKDEPKPVDDGYRCSQCSSPADAPPASHARAYAPRRPGPILCERCQLKLLVLAGLRAAPVSNSPAWARLSEWEIKFLRSMRKQAASGVGGFTSRQVAALERINARVAALGVSTRG